MSQFISQRVSVEETGLGKSIRQSVVTFQYREMSRSDIVVLGLAVLKLEIGVVPFRGYKQDF